MQTEEMRTMYVVGLMSGTSVDGIDAALVKINPDLSFKMIEGLVFPYPKNIELLIYEMFNNKVELDKLCKLNFLLGEFFALAALKVIEKAGFKPEQVDLIASHGQTIFHAPNEPLLNNLSQNSTLQIGEPSIIAERTGITTISDFRTRDIAAGGHGAPLVCYADKLMFSDKKTSRAIQNIGGMGNVTVVSPECEIFAFDTGPGNVLIDYYTQKLFNKPYDKDGMLASQGKTDKRWLSFLLSETYYEKKPPKTTGRELFSVEYAEKMLKNSPSNPYDIITTITALTAKTIYNAYTNFIFPKTTIDELILGGGGAYNPELIKLLRKYFPSSTKIKTHYDYGISSKFKEAIAFALLGYSSFYKLPNNIPSCTGAKKAVVLGKTTFA